MKLFHSSVEGAQHGDKGLDGFLKFAHDAGANGAQPQILCWKRLAVVF